MLQSGPFLVNITPHQGYHIESQWRSLQSVFRIFCSLKAIQLKWCRFMSCSRVKLFINPTLVKSSSLLSADNWICWLYVIWIACWEILTNICARTFENVPPRRSMCSTHAQCNPLYRGDKLVCTHAVQYVTKRYVIHTDNAQTAAVEAESLYRLSGFSLSKEDFQCWQMDDGEKRNGVEGL